MCDGFGPRNAELCTIAGTAIIFVTCPDRASVYRVGTLVHFLSKCFCFFVRGLRAPLNVKELTKKDVHLLAQEARVQRPTTKHTNTFLDCNGQQQRDASLRPKL